MNSKALIAALSILGICGCSTAPSADEAAKAVKNVMPVNFQVLQVRPLKQVPGLAEVVVKVETQQQPIVVYLDTKARYLVSGSVIELETKKNLTMDAQKQYEKK